MSAATNNSLGRLRFHRALDHPELLSDRVFAMLRELGGAPEVGVAEIDPSDADTQAFCERYHVPLGQSANCVIVSGRREGLTRFAACVVLATTRADVNGVVRRRLDVRKASFAPVEAATAATGMEYGGITPIGLPDGWPILVDASVALLQAVVVGSGLRKSKLLTSGAVIQSLPGAEVVESLAR